MLRILIFPAILAGLAVAAAGLAQAQVQANPAGGIRVQVSGHRDVQGANPNSPPGSANVMNLTSGQGQTVELGSNGRADVTGLSDGVYLVTVASGDRTGTTYVQVKDGKLADAQLGAQGLPKNSTFARDPQSLLAAARDAAAVCDRAAYDAAVTELERDQSMVEINLRDLDRLLDAYAQSTGMRPDLELLEKTRDIILRGALTGRGGGATAARNSVPTNQNLRYLPEYIAAVKERARLEGRLNRIRAARQAVPPFPEKCARDAAALFQQAGLQVLFGGDLALIFVNRPQFAPFRLELAGLITKLGAFKPDDTDTGAKIGFSAGMRWDSSILGTKQLGLEAKLWYVDYNMKDSGDVIPEPGGTVGLFSPPTAGNPFGGYSVNQPLTNGWYNADVKSFGGEVQAQTWIESGAMRLMPSVGMRLGRTTVKEEMSFDVGAPVFTSFEQRNDIKDTYFGPTLGLKARVNLAGGLYGFAEGSVGLEYHHGKGDWQTLVPAVDAEPRKDRLSSSKWGVSAGLKAGLGFEIGGFNAQVSAGMSYTNASPYLEYKEDDSTTTGTGGADIGYGSQTDYFGELRLSYRF